MQSRYKWQLDSELYPRGWTWRNLVMHVAAVFLPYFVTATLFHELYAAAVRQHDSPAYRRCTARGMPTGGRMLSSASGRVGRRWQP
jgi:hypothetical protein